VSCTSLGKVKAKLRPTVSRPFGQSVLVWSLICGSGPHFCYSLVVVGLYKWDTLSDEGTGLSFTIVISPRQRRQPLVLVPRDLWTCFTVPYSRLFQLGGPGPSIYIHQEQSYFTTHCLPPFIESWPQSPCDWGLESLIFIYLFIYFSIETLQTPLTRQWVCLLWICLAFFKCTYHNIACYWKFVLLWKIQVLSQSRLYKADHVYLIYLMLQRQISHFNDFKIDRRQV
jgi:hypothetical protein